jgi:hypothetical protein
VFANRHPEMVIDFMNVNSEVRRMIKRAKAGQASQKQEHVLTPSTEAVEKSVQPDLPGIEPTSGEKPS